MDAEAIVLFVAIIAIKIWVMTKLDLTFWEAGAVIKLTVLLGFIIFSHFAWKNK
ncbi:MAG TPA: hypothetical protein PKI88_09610 [Agitococcus sp.]|nr:hypothetical protein [Agitococcus sp.]HNL37347.1 hypothetical protein [Agitococcus sp.]